MKPVFSVAVALSLIGLSFVVEALAAGGSNTNVMVEVLIFSGRPNPTWQLQDTNRLQALKGKLNGLPEAFKEEPAEWSRLGFAGFRIHGGKALGLPDRIRVYRGVIQTGHGKAARHVMDIAGLEQWLIQEAKQQPLEQPMRDVIANYETTRKVETERR